MEYIIVSGPGYGMAGSGRIDMLTIFEVSWQQSLNPE
jgi:hypothetical protein